ncbi:DUF4157 domain-containing protein [Pelotomaculum terephthalicicum JT]|uniref:eCIS core domain-containing protein n=1 Tax=Pelotomaculum terephthalicicum TaxID=206393 RepID=UPI001F04802F|nr:DUF4157 domain-containing protein [Pelotomaculum terephthalicicum]MCG9968442.1 DUF4157 domain-containing protein [Pelotomaculum terephthalicicum JT]
MYDHQVSKKSNDITKSSEQHQQARSLGTRVQQSTAQNIFQLQRTIGNQATLDFLRKNSGLWVQAKLRIGKPGDEYEQNADETANQVVEYINMPESKSARRESPPGELQTQPESGVAQRQEDEEEELQMQPESGTVQRQEEEEEELQMQPESGTVQRQEEEEEELQMQPESGIVQRQEDREEELQMQPEPGTVQRQEEEEEELQMQAEPGVVQRQETGAGGVAKPGIEMAIRQARGGGQAIESQLQRKMGNAFGTSFRDVKIYTDTRSDLLNRSLGARAFTTGRDIFFRQGEYNPGSNSGQKLLAHELTHVVQQSGTALRMSLSPIQLKTRSHAVIQMQYDKIDEWLEKEAVDDKKDGLWAFFNSLSEAQQKIAVYIIVNKKDITTIKQEEISDLSSKAAANQLPVPGLKDFQKKIKKGLIFKGVDWDRFSDVIRFTKGAVTSESVAPTTGSEIAGYTATGVSVGGTGMSKILGLAVGSPIGSIASVIGSGIQVGTGLQEEFGTGLTEGEFNETHTVKVIGGLADIGRHTSTAVTGLQELTDIGASTATAMQAAGILAVIGGAYTLIGGIIGLISHEDRRSVLEKLGGSFKKELEDFKNELDVHSKELKELAKVKNPSEQDQKKIKETEAQVNALMRKIKEKEKLLQAADIGAGTQARMRNKSAVTAAQGAALIAGGALVIASATNPVGWVILGVAALIGGIGAVYNWYKKRQRKKELVDELLKTDVYVEELKKSGSKKVDRDKARNHLLQKQGFNSVDQLYSCVLFSAAEEAYKKGVAGDDKESAELIENLGLEIDKKTKRPTVEEIAKKLHG